MKHGMENGEKKKRKRPGGKTLMGAALALVLLGGAGWGLGSGGNGLRSGLPAMAQPTAEETKPTSAPEITVSPALERELPIIIVRENDILYGDEIVTGDMLKERVLADYQEDGRWLVKNDRAKKAAYDAAKGVLDDLDMPYVLE